MIAIGPKSAQPQQITSMLDTSRRESLAAVINILTDSNLKASELTSQRVSEDMLFAAVTHQELEQKDPALAQKLIDGLKTRYRRKLNHKTPQPLFRAVDDFLHRAVSRGELSKPQRKQITRKAFGMAQLDSKETYLRRRPQTVSGIGNTNVERVLNQVEQNEPASRAELRTFRDRVQSREPLNERQLRRNRRMLHLIHQGPTNTGSVSAAPAPTETDRPAPLPDYNTIATSPNDFVYKPISLDGNALVQIPRIYSDRVWQVEFRDEQQHVLHSLRYSGLGDDGRSYFRLDQPIDSLAGSFTVRMQLSDGGYIQEWITDPNEFSQREYLASS